jgi:hypothetical protein
MKVFLENNIARLQQNFIYWSDQIADLRPAFKLFIPEFQNSRYGWILAGRTVDGVRFSPLTPRYSIVKNKIWGRKPILVASGKLLNAVRGGGGWTQSMTKKELTMGINLPYASYHQDGTSKMAQRNYFLTKSGTLNKMDYAQLLQAMEGQIEDATKVILNEAFGGSKK